MLYLILFLMGAVFSMFLLSSRGSFVVFCCLHPFGWVLVFLVFFLLWWLAVDSSSSVFHLSACI